MANGSLKDLYLDELDGLYDTETQKILMLSRLAEAAQTPDLRAALERHSLETRLHLERLQLIFTHWGELHRSRRCAGLAGVVQEADARLHDLPTLPARDAAIAGVAHRIAWYEIAAYGTARLYARWLNRLDDVRLLEESIDAEERADRLLTEIAEAYLGAALSAA